MKLLVTILLLLAIPITAQKQSGKDHWPSFRGHHAAGVADGQNLPEAWDGEKGTAIKWKAAIPGLAHS
ncbi:MAG: PQQ-binding-like beta-propeller repeat protein, partial [Blastocatellia bacterium]